MSLSRKNYMGYIALLILSLLFFSFSICTTGWCIDTSNRAKVFRPSGFGIMRYHKSDFTHDSDHIIIPLEWQNTSVRDMLISEPYLRLREFNKKDGRETKVEYIFLMAGEFNDLTPECIAKNYSISNSLILSKLSISKKLLLFHNQYWWDDKRDKFRFDKNKWYHVFIGYHLNSVKQSENYLFDMWIDESLPGVGSIDVLPWQFWYLSEYLAKQRLLQK